jgi:hypothetical protein
MMGQNRLDKRKRKGSPIYIEDDVEFILNSFDSFWKKVDGLGTQDELKEIKAVVKALIAAFRRNDAEMGYKNVKLSTRWIKLPFRSGRISCPSKSNGRLQILLLAAIEGEGHCTLAFGLGGADLLGAKTQWGVALHI